MTALSPVEQLPSLPSSPVNAFVQDTTDGPMVDMNENATIASTDMEDQESLKQTRFQNLMEAEERKIQASNKVKVKQVAPQFEIDNDPMTDKGFGCLEWWLIFMSWFLFAITMPVSLFFGVKLIRDYEKAVTFRLGRVKRGGDKGPGAICILPCVDSYTNIDMRIISFGVAPQEILTRDTVSVSVEIVVYYRVRNATTSVTTVGNPYTSTALLAQTSLRNVIATKNLQYIITNRVEICSEIKEGLNEVTYLWGINVERVEIKDLKLPDLLQKAMNSEMEAETEAKAKLKAAEGEQSASVALLRASEILGKSPTALQLRYLQTLNKIAAQRNSTIVFPVPVDVMPLNMPTVPTMPTMNFK